MESLRNWSWPGIIKFYIPIPSWEIDILIFEFIFCIGLLCIKAKICLYARLGLRSGYILKLPCTMQHILNRSTSVLFSKLLKKNGFFPFGPVHHHTYKKLSPLWAQEFNMIYNKFSLRAQKPEQLYVVGWVMFSSVLRYYFHYQLVHIKVENSYSIYHS